MGPHGPTLIAVTAGVAVAVVLIFGLMVDATSGGGRDSSDRAAWQVGFNGCCFDDGLRNAAIMSPPTVPNGTSAVYLQGSLSIASWTHWNGTTNVTGGCQPPTGPPGVCDAYVGVWSSSAWDEYAAGGPMNPAWCYPGNGSACAPVNNATFNTSSLTSLEGQPFEIVIWNTQFYGLVGEYAFSLFVSPNFWSS